MFQAFLDFRFSVIERRAKYKLSQAQERKHIVEVCNKFFSVVLQKFRVVVVFIITVIILAIFGRVLWWALTIWML